MDIVTRGVLKELFTLPISTSRAKYPTFIAQVLQIKELSSTPTGPKRFRLVISDGDNFVQCMLSSQHNELVYSNQITKGQIIRVRDYTPSNMKDKLVIVLLDIEVLAEFGVRDKIGAPGPIDLKTKQEDGAGGDVGGTTFYGNQQKPNLATVGENKMQGMMAGGGGGNNGMPASKIDSAHANIYAIEGLSPYQNKWTIKARVTFKSEIKHWHNARGEGKLFAVHFLDETGEIKATGFNEAVDQFHDLLHEGQVYYVSKCRVAPAKKQFSNVQNEYELVFDRDSEIEKCDESDAAVPQMRFNFVRLGQLDGMEKDSVVDVLGVVQDVRECSQITSKSTGRPYDKRDITLVDESSYSVTVSLWGKSAIDFDVNSGAVIAFKGAKVNDFNGSRSLSLLQSSSMTTEPDIAEAHKLKGWYDSSGHNETFSNLQSAAGASDGTAGAAAGRQDVFKTIQQVKDEQLGMSEQADYFSLKATVIFYKQENFSYPACPTEGCNKKVLEDGEGGWRCERCDRSYPSPQHRYVLQFNVYDHTGQLWLSGFDDVGRLMLGKTAGEFIALKEEDSDVFLEAINARTGLDWVFRCRAKQDSYQNQIRVRYSAVSATSMNYAAEAQALTKLLEAYKIE